MPPVHDRSSQGLVAGAALRFGAALEAAVAAGAAATSPATSAAAPSPRIRRAARVIRSLPSGHVARLPAGCADPYLSYFTRRLGVSVEPSAGDARGADGDQVKQWLAELTLEEKCRLVGGASSWRTHPIERLGIPEVKLSDGPNGVRGEHTAGSGTASVLVPVGIAQGATWDPDLIGRVGDLLGREARRKSAHVLLAPAVNLHRTPIGGRTFEYFSEDPELTAAMAVATVRGVQAHDVAVTVKHFVA